MATRNIRVDKDPVLGKVCKEVREMTDRTAELIEDMIETMYEANGVGLAAPQVGILKRIAVVDVSQDEEEDGLYILINPKVVETEGSQTGYEGCLSIPGKLATVTRPQKVKVEALDMDMQPYTIEGEGLLARALCHEIDHLDGHLYSEIAESPLVDADSIENEEE